MGTRATYASFAGLRRITVNGTALPNVEGRIEAKRVEVQHNDSIPRLIDRYGRP